MLLKIVQVLTQFQSFSVFLLFISNCGVSETA